MRRLLAYISVILSSLIVVTIFTSATTYTQLGVAVVLYPLVILLIYGFFYYRPKNKTAIVQSTATDIKAVTSLPSDETVADTNKREFLKMIGMAGLSLFLFSLFTRKSEALFFGKTLDSGSTVLEDSKGNKIDPAERQPTDGYRITEIDENDITYYGFVNKLGAWYIMKENYEEGSFRYSRGDIDFPGNWKKREKLSYDYFNNIFS